MRSHHRILLLLACVLVALTVLIIIQLNKDECTIKKEPPAGFIEVFLEEEEDEDLLSFNPKLLSDLTLALDSPRDFQDEFGDDVIFFVETSEKGRLNVRQVCTLEALCLHNPNTQIFVLFPYPVKEIDLKRSPALLELLRTRDNVRLVSVDSVEVMRGTPLEEIAATKLTQSPTLKEHLSDFIRLGILWKLGGVYMDFDLITFKNIVPIAKLKNFVTADGEDQVNTAMCGFEQHHPFLQKIMECVRDSYDPMVYSTVPFSFNDAIKEYFEVPVSEAIKRGRILDVSILDQAVISPVTYVNYTHLLDYRMSNLTDEMVLKSYGAHLWGSLTSKFRLRVESKAPYAAIARKFCPNALKHVIKYF